MLVLVVSFESDGLKIRLVKLENDLDKLEKNEVIGDNNDDGDDDDDDDVVKEDELDP